MYNWCIILCLCRSSTITKSLQWPRNLLPPSQIWIRIQQVALKHQCIYRLLKCHISEDSIIHINRHQQLKRPFCHQDVLTRRIGPAWRGVFLTHIRKVPIKSWRYPFESCLLFSAIFFILLRRIMEHCEVRQDCLVLNPNPLIIRNYLTMLSGKKIIASWNPH